MKLTARSEYALLALIYLGRQPADVLVSAETVAIAQGIPPKFLEQIFLSLRRAKYLRSTKGHRGGYQLARSPTEINLAEVVRLFDGALAPTESASRHFYEPTPIEKEEKLLNLFKGIRDWVSARMEATTLADML
jgi:Rrf2 family protein